MKLANIVSQLNLEIKFAGNPDAEVKTAYTSDLMSDVMAHAKENSVLITIQSHKNSVAVASMVDLPAIFICNKRPIPEDMVKAAELEDIGIFRTTMDQFELSWRVHEILKA